MSSYCVRKYKLHKAVIHVTGSWRTVKPVTFFIHKSFQNCLLDLKTQQIAVKLQDHIKARAANVLVLCTYLIVPK